jgi:hypothetical protein
MNRRSLCSAGFFASVVVVLITALSACTDPNNTQINDPSGFQARERQSESRTPR